MSQTLVIGKSTTRYGRAWGPPEKPPSRTDAKIDERMAWGDNRKTFRLLKTVTNKGQQHTPCSRTATVARSLMKKAVLHQWTEHCSELYNLLLMTDPNILQEYAPRSSKVTPKSVDAVASKRKAKGLMGRSGQAFSLLFVCPQRRAMMHFLILTLYWSQEK